MKLYPECGPCMLNRALLFCEGADEETKYRVVREVCRIFAEDFSAKASTTETAYRRNKAIEGLIKSRDPLKALKKESMEAAKKVYPLLEEHLAAVSDERGRFKTALKIALAGNIVEFGARDHKPNLARLAEEIFEVVSSPLSIDDSDKVYDRIRGSREVLYVTDNAGEAVFDKILIKEIQRYAKVSVAPLSRPVQDDASIEEIRDAGIDSLCPVIPRSDSIGVWFERCTEEFLERWDESDFIIVKGMGCYETLVDYPEKTGGRVALLMKAKCGPVARDVGVPLGGTVVKIL
ncbi:MAG: DUF89 family protein [Candidatus Altiarchaeota archaeon]|nr:DUF89 family protein [Candidatus Altiarchaeota archaeon]